MCIDGVDALIHTNAQQVDNASTPLIHIVLLDRAPNQAWSIEVLSRETGVDQKDF